MSIGFILLVILVVMLLGGLPNWGHSRNWGYGPSGIIGLLLIVCLICLIADVFPRF